MSIYTELFNRARSKLTSKRTFKQWMLTEFYIPDGNYKSTLFSANGRYWVNPVLDIIDSGKYSSNYLCATPQTGKTVLATGWLEWQLFENGNSCQCILPTSQLSTMWFKDRFEASVLENNKLRKLLPASYAPKSSFTDTLRTNNGGWIKNVHSAAQIRLYSSNVIFVSEAAQFKGATQSETDMLSMAIKRTASFDKYYALYESTPTTTDAKFHKDIELSTDSRLHVACIHCNEFINAGDRHNFRVEGEVENELTCYIECPKCGGKITEEHREAMQKTCKIVHKNEHSSTFGVTIDWFFAKKPMKELAILEFRNKQTPSLELIRDIYQNYYAMPTNQKIEQPERSVVGISKEMILERKGNYSVSKIPERIKFVTAGVDIQKDWLYYLILGYDENMTAYYLSSDHIDIVERQYQKQVEPTVEMLLNALETMYVNVMKSNPTTIWLDTSFKHTASSVPIIRQWCCKYSNVMAVAGRAHTEFVRIDQQTSQLPVACRDFMMPRVQANSSQVLWFIDTDRVKSTLRDKMAMPPFSEGGFQFPKEIGEMEYVFRHFTAEEPRIIKQRSGIDTLRWEKVKGKHCDLFDCCVYAFCGGLLYAGMNNLQAVPAHTLRKRNTPVVSKPAIAAQSKPVRQINKKRSQGMGLNQGRGFNRGF